MTVSWFKQKSLWRKGQRRILRIKKWVAELIKVGYERKTNFTDDWSLNSVAAVWLSAFIYFLGLNRKV